MENVKLTSENYQNIINDILNDVGTSRTNIYYFSNTDINESTIRQAAWDNNIILNLSTVDGFISTMSFLKLLN